MSYIATFSDRGSVKSISFTAIPIPIGDTTVSVRFHILPIDIPFLLSLADIDR